MTLRRTILAAAVLTASTGAVAHAQDSLLIASAQRAAVSTLDSGYARTPLSRWLERAGRLPASAIRWEVNDCGEGGDGRKAPTCVEARFAIGKDTIGVSLIVTGLDGIRTPPKVFMLVVQQGERVIFFKTLRDLEGFMREQRR